ncbi:MAG: hypothetical protein QW323_01755, partial [Candidatus Bathyarchaeia archaeon]
MRLYSMGLPSRIHKTVKVPADWLHETILQIIPGVTAEEEDGRKTFKSTIGWKVGVTLKIRVIPEGEVS